MVRRIRAGWGFLAAAVLISSVFAWPAIASIQLLQNGGFEGGVTGWSLVNASTSGCSPRSGAAALVLSPAPQALAAAQQQVSGVAAGLGPYILTGYSKLGSGSASVKALLRWIDANGGQPTDDETALPLGPGYAGFVVSTSAAPAGTSALQVRIIASGSGLVCVDDLSLEGPPPVTLTPSPTATPLPTSTPLASATPTKTPAAPTATKTLSPTKTPTPVSPTKTPRPPTATRTPSNTPGPSTPAGVGLGVQAELLNGGFEAGLAPWQKFGGELRAVQSPVNSGSSAGALASTTTSTKWAYQIVAVEPGETYEFSGFLRPGVGVAEAFLRISWYESQDGSGRTIGSVDSAVRLAGSADSYIYLTTGGVTAPDGARSARLRAMLTPSGASLAILYLDDFAFGPSEEPAGADGPQVREGDEEDVAGDPSSAVMSGSGGEQAPKQEQTAEVRGSRVTRAPTREADRSASEANDTGQRPGASPLPYVLLASFLTAGAMAGAFWYGRRSSRD